MTDPTPESPVTIARTADDVERAARCGFVCPDCGHDHMGQHLAFICIGCLCPRVSPLFEYGNQAVKS